MSNRIRTIIVIVVVFLLALVLVNYLGDDKADASTNEGVCGPLTSGKIDTTGDPQTVTVTLSAEEIAAGKVITGYCVKAGSDKQEDGGPEYVELDTPVTTITFGHSTGKAVSHYSYTVGVKPTEEPTTPTETPTTPTETPTTPTETPTTPTETPNNTPSTVPNPGKPVQMTECVDGVFVTTLDGEVVSESGTCDEATTSSSTPTVAQEEGL